MSDYLDPNNEELLKDFFAEAQLQIEQLEQNILVLENDPANKDAIDEIFRAAHTLKGASATVQMTEISSFTHLVEDVLDEIRSESVGVNGEVVDILLSSIDIIKEMLDSRSRGQISTVDIVETEAKLHGLLPDEETSRRNRAAKKASKLQPQQAKAAESKPEVQKTEKTTARASKLSEYEILEMKQAAGRDKKVYCLTVSFDESNLMNTVGGIQVFAILKGLGEVLKTEPDFEKLYEDVFYPEVHYYLSTNEPESAIRGKLDLPDVITSLHIEVVGSSIKAESVKTEPAPKLVAETKTDNSEIVADKSGKETSAVKSTAATQLEIDEEHKAAGTVQADAKKVQAAGSVLRVDSRRIDNLLNLVSETVITKASFNQIGAQFNEVLSVMQSTRVAFADRVKDLFESLPEFMSRLEKGITVKDVRRALMDKYGSLVGIFDPVESRMKASVGKFRGTAQILGRISGELQEGVMRIRMVPISQIFSRFPRLVRDLSKSLGKKINLVIEGEETELDKSVIEDLLDPIIHCVRNSIDHGIEDPAVRKKAGKPEDGTIILKASNEGNMIVIEVIDDGKGIDTESVRQRAVDRGIIHPNKILSDVEAYNLIFEAGFSTAKSVTSISGRGVGLDVVRKQIEKLNGSVSVSSEKGRGSKFTIKLPLTLAIIQGLLVRVGNEKYAIPITSVIDSHRVRPADLRLLDNHEVFNVRDDVISILRLNRLFKIQTDENREYYYVVIVGSGDQRMGLIVDSLIGEEDVVIKPLRDQFTNVPGIAGANITGDGTVSLIIDVPQLLELSLRREVEERKRRESVFR